MKKGLNTMTDKVTTGKRITCWFCHINGRNILDKDGKCKRCGTNLKKYPIRDKHPYPNMKNLDREVLGHRDKFYIPDDSDQNNW